MTGHRSLVFGGALHFLDGVLEIVHALEAAIDGGETDIGDLVEPAQLPHHHLADAARLDLALAESEERYRSVIAGLTEGVMLIAPDGQCLTANESAERILGLTRDELMGRKLRDPAWGAVYADGTPFPPSRFCQ